MSRRKSTCLCNGGGSFEISTVAAAPAKAPAAKADQAVILRRRVGMATGSWTDLDIIRGGFRMIAREANHMRMKCKTKKPGKFQMRKWLRHAGRAKSSPRHVRSENSLLGEGIPRKNISRIDPLNPRAVSGSAGTLAGEKFHGQLVGKGAGAPSFMGSFDLQLWIEPYRL